MNLPERFYIKANGLRYLFVRSGQYYHAYLICSDGITSKASSGQIDQATINHNIKDGTWAFQSMEKEERIARMTA